MLSDHGPLKNTGADQAAGAVDARNAAGVFLGPGAAPERGVQDRSRILSCNAANRHRIASGFDSSFHIQVPDHGAFADVAEHALIRTVGAYHDPPDGMTLSVKYA